MAETSFTVFYFAGEYMNVLGLGYTDYRLYTAARTETGVHKEVIPVPLGSGVPLSRLADLLASRHPETKLREVLEISSWSVDEEMVDEDQIEHVVLKGGEEVGVICPVSGG